MNNEEQKFNVGDFVKVEIGIMTDFSASPIYKYGIVVKAGSTGIPPDPYSYAGLDRYVQIIATDGRTSWHERLFVELVARS